ncbi:MAG: M36 family metallopeptidase [Acidobacteria bacterium]|nr:M36 family metallopeptidase [Acidobacteriota bacterium]
MRLQSAVSTLLLTATVTLAQVWPESPRSSRGHARDFDIRTVISPETATPLPAAASPARARREALRQKLLVPAEGRRGWRVSLSERGLPQSIYAEGRGLTEPATGDAEQLAREFLTRQQELFGLNDQEVSRLRLLRRTPADGLVYLRFQQTVKGLDVFEGQLRVTVDGQGRVMEAGAGDLLPGLDVEATPSLSADAAVRAAYGLLQIPIPTDLKTAGEASSRGAKFENPRGTHLTPVSAELVVFPLTPDTGALAYRLMIELDGTGWYEMLLDAHDGKLMFLHNLYRDATARVWKESPLKGTRSLIELPAPWLSGTVTTGNNVDAYLDRDANNQADTTGAAGLRNGRAFSAEGVFDFPWGDRTISESPLLRQPAAVTNLFYFVNLAHDFYYGLGFDEASGNFQTDNFDKGGKGNDAIRAEAQDGSTNNNANFATPAEGTAPRMQMGLFTYGSTVATDFNDSSNDGMIVFHEYGHGVSNRMVGGGTSTSCLFGVQSGAMGEGWSDYLAATYFNNPLMSAYSSRNTFAGIRRSGYERYPFTYEDLGNLGFQVHRDGEIWAATLWDIRRRLGAETTDKLVVSALRVTPCRPSMIAARDAILATDELLNAGANRATLWQVFAARGMGKSATGTDGAFPVGTVFTASYDVPLPEDSTLNRNPVVVPKTVPVVGMGQTFSYKLEASDADGDPLTFNLVRGPQGLTVDPATGQIQWTAAFSGDTVMVEVVDGKGGRAVHCFGIFVQTILRPGVGLPVSLFERAEGFAAVVVPAGTPVLQITARGGYGDADVWLANPDGIYVGHSYRGGNVETLSIAAPKAGVWWLEVDSFRAFAGVTLTAALPTPRVLTLPATLTALAGEFTSEAFYRVTVAANTPLLRVTTDSGNGDVDLLVRKAAVPVCSADDVVNAPCVFDSISLGLTTEETVSILKPAAEDYYINLRAFQPYAGVRLRAEAIGLRVLPAELAFSATLGSPAPEGQKVAISDFSGVAFTWTATAGEPWIGLDRRIGDQATPLTVSVSAQGLTAGTYSANITITVPNAAGSPLTIPVTLTVK